jgi:DNA polymerase elongation subunit (family B)
MRQAILEHRFGVGGLHWCCGPGTFEDVIDIDAISFYPHIIVNWHLTPDWIKEDGYKKLIEQRILGNKDPQLKMALNTVTGKLRMTNASVEDKDRGLTMCLLGQILITILKEKLVDAGAKIIQINTDGIMIQAHDSKYFDATREWIDFANIPLKIKDIDKLEQADVNNYRATFCDGTIKTKGVKFK